MTQSQGIAILVLAAGAGRRMGGGKQLVVLDGETLIERAVDTALASGLGRVVVIVGHDAERVCAAIGDRPVTIVKNEGYGDGLSSSIRRGISVLDEDTMAVIIHLADMPDVDAALLCRLAEAFEPDKDHDVVVPMYKNHRGNPVLFGRKYFDQLARLTGDTGARQLLSSLDRNIVAVPAQSDGILVDLDTNDDVDRWLERVR
jgi:molybdenum cofactor cytidylyltransferase